MATEFEVERLTEADFPPIDAAKASLGQLLFYDPILSGNRNISCGTCHHHDHASADGLSLGIGEGGTGVGPDRSATDIDRRVPRNAPALFNLGARQVDTLFHDGRLSVSDLYGNGFNSPAEEYLPNGLDSILAAQALFPLASETEMAGQSGENAVAGAANDRIDKAWRVIEDRVRRVPAYGPLFVETFEDVSRPADIRITHVGNALGAFVGSEWRSHDSRWDRYLAGTVMLNDAEMRGARLFLGDAGCSGCHAGKMFTDHGFRALALPPIGPGRTRRFDPMARDVGRMGETDRLEDAYRFRTPSLRNVALTAPYGHNGAYRTLEGMIRHHLSPLDGLAAWPRTEPMLPPVPDRVAAIDFIAHQDRFEMARIAAQVDIRLKPLSDGQIADIITFLHTLTGGDSVKGRLGRPDAVPSGLPVD